MDIMKAKELMKSSSMCNKLKYYFIEHAGIRIFLTLIYAS